MDAKDIISDFKESFFDRIRNPFVLLYIISWLGWNWLIVFELFSFPLNYTLDQKISIISGYIKLHKWGNLTFFPIWSSFLGALCFVAASSFFLILFSWFQRTLKPKIYKLTAKDENIPRYLYDSMHRRYDRLKTAFDDTKNLYAEFDEIKKTLENRISILDSEKMELKSLNTKQELTILENKKKLQDFQTAASDSEEIFLRTLANDKFWFLYYEDQQKKDVKAFSQVRFNQDKTVTDSRDRILFKVQNISVTDGNQIITFKLIDHKDRQISKIQYIFPMGNGRFQGVEVALNGQKQMITYSDKQVV